jgi:hypothetical protein
MPHIMPRMSDERPWVASYPSDVPHSIAPMPSESVFGLLESAAGRFHDRPAIAWFGKHLSYKQLLHEVELCSAMLAGLGIRDPRPGQLEEVLRRTREEHDQRHRHDVGRIPVGQVELDRHPAARDRIGVLRPRMAAGIRESDGRLDRLTLQVCGPGELRRLGRRGEGALADRALRVDSAEAGVGPTVDRLERVDDLLPHRCGRHGRSD